MVETATQPEVRLPVHFRANAEVKFMNSMSKPKKKSVIKTGKIPIVQAGTSSCLWPAGNPTDTKHCHEEVIFDRAQDESHYASKEVERLQDDLRSGGSQQKKSDIIERITESRHQRHKQALEDLHEELGHLNKTIDPQVCNHMESCVEQTGWILSEIHILFSSIQSDAILYFYPLKQLEAMWDDMVKLLEKRSNLVRDLRDQIHVAERERKDHISELFKYYSDQFHRIAYLSTDEINVLMDQEVYTANRLLLENYRRYADITAQLQLENVTRLREMRGRWEERLATWRDLHISDTRDKFISFMETPAITECPDIAAIVGKMEKERECLVERGERKMKAVLRLRPPGITSQAVLAWYEDVCKLGLEIENTHRRYMSQLDEKGRCIVADCIGVADEMLATLQTEGVSSADEVESLKTAELMPLVDRWRESHLASILEWEREFTERSADFNANLHVLYEFHQRSAEIWTEYRGRMTGRESELMGLMKECRSKHDEINQGLESALDMDMDRMRQDTNEGELARNLEKSVESLKEIAAAYDAFRVELGEVIERYPGMVEVELEAYATNIRRHLGQEKKKEEEEAPVEGGEEGEEMGITDNNTEEKEEDTFLTEVPVPVPAYSDPRFSEIQAELVGIFMEHLSVLAEEVMEESRTSVEERLSELKSEIELRHHIHAPRPMRMKLDIYNVRLSELKGHDERVKQHSAGVALEIAKLKGQFKEKGAEHAARSAKFRAMVEKCEGVLPTLEKSAQLSSLQAKVTSSCEDHVTLIKTELASFRNRMEEKLNDLRESNQHFGLAFKPFAEGGNFGPEEIEKYRKKLEKCNLKIDNCETFILTELDGMESKCLEGAAEISASFEGRLKMYILDVAFLERVNSWMSNCQVKIKTEVAACNMMSKNLKHRIEKLKGLIDSCARPHPDKPVVKPAEVIAIIPEIYELFQKRISYLDCSKSSAASVSIAPDQPGTGVGGGAPSDIPQPEYDFTSVVNLAKNIMSLSKIAAKDRPEPDSQVTGPDKKKAVPVEPIYAWFVARQSERSGERLAVPPAGLKRGKSRGDTAERKTRLGSSSSRCSLMSGVQPEVQSFIPLIKRILQETQGALFLSSETYYGQCTTGPPLRPDIADTLELCMEGLNKRLNGYYLQADDYFNKCIQDLRTLLTEFLALHLEIPALLFAEILETHVTRVSQATALVKHEFEKSRAKIHEQRESNKTCLKPILGHPNNEVDLNNLCAREEDRALFSGDTLNQFVNEMTVTETDIAKSFVKAVNSQTRELLDLFDMLVTTDDVIKGKTAEKKLPTTVLLKHELRTGAITGAADVRLTKEGRSVALLKLADITTAKEGSRPNTAPDDSDRFLTVKFTPAHASALEARDGVVGEFTARYRRVVEELALVSGRWLGDEEKWSKQWGMSVMHVRNLYKPA